MSKFYKVLWSLAILVILVTTVTFTFGIILFGVSLAGMVGIYRYYLGRKHSINFQKWPRKNSSNEVIDITAEPPSDNLRLKP